MLRPRMAFDVLIKNGLLFDGTGAPGVLRDVGIQGGRVTAVSDVPLDESGSGQVIDARGKWVLPGFLDCHTHYDAELLAAPSLSESVRHGVTTVTVGRLLDQHHPLGAGGLLRSVHARGVDAA